MSLIRRVETTWDSRPAKAAARRASDRGLTAAAEHILGVSRNRVPIEEGTLMRSGSTDVADGEAVISYDTPYAVRQHEELSYRHAPGRTAKYLENPLREEASTVRDILVREARGEY